MIEGTIVLRNAAATFGMLAEQKTDDGGDIYVTTFADASGLSVSVLWDIASAKEFFQGATEAMSGVVPVRKPKLQIAQSIPSGARVDPLAG